MTNFEWLKSLNVDDFAEWTGIVASGDMYDGNASDDVDSLKNFTTWCHDKGCRVGNCDSCIKKWLETEYVVPMPMLENGIFVTGVIIGDNIVDQSGEFDSINKIKNKIIKAYDAKCFNECDDEYVTWKRL